jgi:hypothetical protein
LRSIYQKWRGEGLFSFLNVAFHGPIGEAEHAWLFRLKQCADWIILDADTSVVLQPPALQIERYEALAHLMKRIDGRIGLRLKVDARTQSSVIGPWITKLALVVEEPGFLFIETMLMASTIELIRDVQHRLWQHSLSRGSARLIPLIAPSSHCVAHQPYEVLDLMALDGLLIESFRPFFGGVVVHGQIHPALFGMHLWDAVVSMITMKCSAESLFANVPQLAEFVPLSQQWPLVRQVYHLLAALAKGDCPEIGVQRKGLETLWNPIVQATLTESESFLGVKTVVEDLVEQSRAFEDSVPGSGERRRSVIGSFVRSLNV